MSVSVHLNRNCSGQRISLNTDSLIFLNTNIVNDFQSNRPQVKSAPVKSAAIQIGLKSNRPQVKSASK